MSGDHQHHHFDHDHAPIVDPEGPASENEILETALRELLIDKGVLSASDVHHQIDLMDSRNPALGARVVAKAWTEPAFRTRLVAEPLETIEAAFGMPMSGPVELSILENTPDVHNVVVCTLCSCYPRMLLGIPPSWYKATAYRARIVREPREVLAEFGLELSESVEVRVSDSTADLRYLVIPMRPRDTEGRDAAALAGLVTRDCMIGTAVPKLREH